MQYILDVQNVKCGGCVNTIRTQLGKMAGIQQVEVVQATGRVTVEADVSRESVAEALAKLGYPEKP